MTKEGLMAKTHPDVIVKLHIPEAICAIYEAQGEGNDELEMAARLVACVDHRASSPLYFDDKQRNELELLLDKQLNSAAEALDAIRGNAEIELPDGHKLVIPHDIAIRLKDRLTAEGGDVNTLDALIIRLLGQWVIGSL